MIAKFEGEYAFLSNFYECPIHIFDMDFTSAEAAFQCAKCKNEEDKPQFQHLLPRDAKRLGRKVELRPDWEEIKIEVMRKVVHAKFAQNDDLAKKLIETGNQNLIEGNWWYDGFWGMCNGVGENHLGRILMDLRDNYSWPIVKLSYSPNGPSPKLR